MLALIILHLQLQVRMHASINYPIFTTAMRVLAGIN